MPRRFTRRPPLRVCVVCGRQVATWRHPPVHHRCLQQAGETPQLAQQLRVDRLERWARREGLVAGDELRGMLDDAGAGR